LLAAAVAPCTGNGINWKRRIFSTKWYITFCI